MSRLRETGVARLLGRAVDLTRTEEMLEQARLVTITGTAGVGKTRLAREIARRRVEPCVFVDVTEARGLDELCAAVARASSLGQHGAPDVSIRAAGEALSARGRALVVLDNFEHHVGLATVTIQAWMEAAPDAAFLVTSRERLHVEGEVASDLRPLPVPEPAARLEEVARCDAVQLFVARAMAARGGAEPGDQDLPVIADIVRRLDGVPLAIELAAARADVLSPTQILARLSRPLDLLAGPSRGLPARSTTLRAAIACSWELLGERERDALVECSVFRGGFTLEAAEEVLGHGEVQVVDLVQTLVRKSLLHAGSARGPSRAVRLAMFESVRAFVAEKAAPPPATEERHTEYHLRLAERLARGERSAIAATRLADEHENLLAVLERAERAARVDDHGVERAVVAARAMCALGPAACPGELPEVWISRLDPVIAALERHGVVGAPRPRVLLLRSRAFVLAGRTAAAAADIGAALAALAREPDAATLAEAHIEAARLAETRGYAARALLARARALAEGRGDDAMAARLAGHEGWSRFLEDPWSTEEAFDGIGRGLRGAQAEADRASEARLRAWLGALYAGVGRMGAGRSELSTALALARETGDRALQVESLVAESLVALEAGDLAAARAACDEASALADVPAPRRARGAALGQAARLALHAARPEEAEGALRAAIDGQGCAEDGISARCLLAASLADRDRPEEAERELGIAERWLEEPSSGVSEDPVLRPIAEALGVELLGPRCEDLARAEIALAAAHVELARTRAAEARGDLSEAAELRRSLDGVLRGMRAWREPPSPLSLRFAARLLARAAERAPPAKDALLLGPDAAWFRVPGGELVSLDRRRPLRLVLAFLAKERVARPGVAAPLGALLAAGWPEERVSHESARNRVHVALSTLRKLGLKQVVLSREDGWLLDPSIVIVQSGNDVRGGVPA